MAVLNLIILSTILFVVYSIAIRYRTHLRRVPGPFLSSISNLPRLFSVAGGKAHSDAILLHKQYGTVVRVGPNHVSFSSANDIPTVYSAYTKFEKSDFYVPFDAKTPQAWVPTVFSVRSEHAHRDIKRPIASAYSLTSLLELETLTDDCIRIFLDKLNMKLATSSNSSIELNLGDWLHYYAFDVITSITFSNRLGFMESESDVQDIIAAIEGRLKYNSTIGQWPALHPFLFGNKIVSHIASFIPPIAKLNTGSRIVQFAVAQLKRYENKDKDITPYADMLDRFRRVDNSGSTLMTDQDVLMAALGNIFAGSDTTAISLRSLFYYLMKNPACLSKLVAEIDEADAKNQLSEIVTFAESQKLPYMQACLKEAMRMHPAVGLALERIVPSEGCDIDGYHIPSGTVIGANPWVVARDKEVYGEDADAFRPERWVEVWERAGANATGTISKNTADPAREDQSTTQARAQLKQMERNFFAFGTGSRSCLGKNVSLLEMNKLIPQVFRHYELALVHPEQDWTVETYWFSKQLGLECRIKRRSRIA